jgi:hypothetical protein
VTRPECAGLCRRLWRMNLSQHSHSGDLAGECRSGALGAVGANLHESRALEMLQHLSASCIQPGRAFRVAFRAVPV